MSSIDYYQMTDRDLEEQADFVKAQILDALVDQGILKKDFAEEWVKNHTIIKRNKNLFRTISDLWRKTDVEEGKCYWLVVKKVGDE